MFCTQPELDHEQHLNTHHTLASLDQNYPPAQFVQHMLLHLHNMAIMRRHNYSTTGINYKYIATFLHLKQT